MHLMILAQQAVSRTERLRGMHERFSRVDPDATRGVLLLIIVLAGVLGIIGMLHRWQRSRQQGSELSPMNLFLRTMRKAGLPLADRLRLWHVAHSTRITHPTAMLISVSSYDRAIRRYARVRSFVQRYTRAEQRLQDLRERLFDDTEAAPVPDLP